MDDFRPNMPYLKTLQTSQILMAQMVKKAFERLSS